MQTYTVLNFSHVTNLNKLVEVSMETLEEIFADRRRNVKLSRPNFKWLLSGWITDLIL